MNRDESSWMEKYEIATKEKEELIDAQNKGLF